MFLYMQDNVLRRSEKCCATVRGMFLCGEGFDSEDGFIDFSKWTLFIDGKESRNQLLEDYFTEKTELEYAGNACHFWFKKDVFLEEE